MRTNSFSLGRGVLSLVIFIGFISGVFGEATAADYYKGQVITLLVAVNAGGGVDIWARFITNNLSRFIPGNPTVVVRNIPTAEGLIAANMAWHGKSDGKTLLCGSNKVIKNNMLRPTGTEYQLEKMPPVYASPFGAVFYFKPGLVREAKDIVNAKGLVWGHDAPTSGVSGLWVFAKAVIGFESKDVTGYGGSGPAKLAFITGECNVTGAGSDSYVTSFKGELERGVAVALFQSGLLDPNGNLTRESHLPPMPTVKELYEQIYGKAPSGPAWEAYLLNVACRAYDNPIVMPPSTKPEYVKIMRKAFEDMTKDQEFLKQADRLAKGSTHIVGEPLTRGFAAGVAGKPEAILFMKKFLVEKYGVSFN